MSRLQEFKDSLAEAAGHLEMAEDYIDDALRDLEDAYIGIKSDAFELERIKSEIDGLWCKIQSLQQQTSY